MESVLQSKEDEKRKANGTVLKRWEKIKEEDIHEWDEA